MFLSSRSLSASATIISFKSPFVLCSLTYVLTTLHLAPKHGDLQGLERLAVAHMYYSRQLWWVERSPQTPLTRHEVDIYTVSMAWFGYDQVSLAEQP